MALANNNGAERDSLRRLVDVQSATGGFRAWRNWKADDYEMQLDRWANEGGAIGRQSDQLTAGTRLHRSTREAARSALQAHDRHLSVRCRQVG
jgi:hypothetical protein